MAPRARRRSRFISPRYDLPSSDRKHFGFDAIALR
jgi:hypothetical protein